MVELFTGSSGMAMANQAMPLREPLQDALVESDVKGLCSTMQIGWEYKFFLTNWFYFSFLHYPNSIALKQSTRAPTEPPTNCTSYLVSPSSSLRVFGWLLCFYLSFGGRLRPRGIFFLHLFLSINLTAKWGDIITPIRSTAVVSHLKYPPPTTDTVFWLVVAFFNWLAAI